VQFNIITIFPQIFNSYFNESILARARKNKLIEIDTHDLRDYTEDKHKTVDDTPYGGGAGMVFKIEPIYKALVKIVGKNKLKCFRKGIKNQELRIKNKNNKTKIAMARRFSKLDKIILICGRYEGIDERVAKYLADEEISVGDYILTGGEIPAMTIVDSVSRLIDYLEYPHYTKPSIFSPNKKTNWKVPEVLLSGNHQKIGEWKKKYSELSCHCEE